MFIVYCSDNTITIDPVDARDFDDAISLERTPEGDEKASRTYCAKLFGSGCAQVDRREDDTACAGIYA